MPTQKICADSHQQIIYVSDECPLCQARERMDELLDAKTDIDQENIAELFKRVDRIEKQVKRLLPEPNKPRTSAIISRILGLKKSDESTVEFDA